MHVPFTDGPTKEDQAMVKLLKALRKVRNQKHLGRDLPLESKEVATMFIAEPKARAKHAAKEKSPSPTSNIR